MKAIYVLEVTGELARRAYLEHALGYWGHGNSTFKIRSLPSIRRMSSLKPARRAKRKPKPEAKV